MGETQPPAFSFLPPTVPPKTISHNLEKVQNLLSVYRNRVIGAACRRRSRRWRRRGRSRSPNGGKKGFVAIFFATGSITSVGDLQREKNWKRQ